MMCSHYASFLAAAFWTSFVLALAGQTPDQLPAGSRYSWVVAGPQQVVGWFTFDPVGVADRLPESIRFTTVGELANGGIPWAMDYLVHHPSHTGWGVSFLEIVRADTFAIDGRNPSWPDDGAAAVWFARVLPKDRTDQLGPGLPLLMLEFWLPDAAYATFMRDRGYYATYADVRFRQHGNRWEGSVTGADFSIRVACTPSGEQSGGPDSKGSQVLVPPWASGLTTVVRITFAGHRERTCSEPSSWTILGHHPLTAAVAVEAASFQSGYQLRGGTYARAPEP